INITVADTGIGMSPLDLQRCFETFTQGDHKRGGLGMGLAIARGIVEAHGGTIAAASDGPGCGSSFCVTIATVEPAPNLEGLVSVSDHGGNGKFFQNVLLVE